MRFVLAAGEATGARVLKRLAASSHEITAVMPARRDDPVDQLARSLALPIWPAKLVADPAAAERIRAESVDVLLNVYSMRRVCAEVIDAVAVGAFNLHPGRLPQVAGRNPISAALAHGHLEHGVTVHHMTVEYDAGAIAFQAIFPVEERDTAGSLSVKCARIGVDLVDRLLTACADGQTAIPRIAQDLTQRTLFGPEIPFNGRIDWSRPAHEIVDLVRAYDFTPFRSAWGHPRARLAGRELEIVSARRTRRTCRDAPGTVGEVTGSAVDVASRDEWIAIASVRVDQTIAPAMHWLATGLQLENL